eukprot:2724922-Prymnesium_polylepis.2
MRVPASSRTACARRRDGGDDAGGGARARGALARSGGAHLALLARLVEHLLRAQQLAVDQAEARRLVVQ